MLTALNKKGKAVSFNPRMTVMRRPVSLCCCYYRSGRSCMPSSIFTHVILKSQPLPLPSGVSFTDNYMCQNAFCFHFPIS